MSFDEGGVYYSYQNAEVPDASNPESRRPQIIADFKDFIKNYFWNQARHGTDAELVYRQRLNKENRTLLVDLVHVKLHDVHLGSNLEDDPSYYLPLFERAAKEVLQEDHQLSADGAERHFDDVQVMLYSSENFGPTSMRALTSTRVMKLVQLPGIITAASKPKHKATYITIQCKDCRNKQTIPCQPGMGGALVPRHCNLNQAATGPHERCNPNPFVVLGDSSKYVDQQTLKLQERPEDIPTGELPRTLLAVADRHLVNRVTPGTRVVITGIYCTHRSKAMEKGSSVTLQQPYLRVVAIQEQTEGHKADAFTNEDISEFLEYSRQPEVHESIYKRIAPKIFGTKGSSVDDIKKAIACLLFGGARKVMPDATTRRGDINVLLLGDPSTAKSQFLKFADKVAPISVYTSGKGSSAAGLTAAVVQDASSREFYLEGGAMVLADGGVVCIDEFDKMRPEDRVAIHEAMEQQTISIAKAGITTVLKSRTSVLAAANPPSGRYDDLRTTAENIDLQSTILSRFDLIFIVRDSAEPEKDMAIAKHVLQVHQLANAAQAEGSADREAEERWFKRYIHYCRTHCFPRLNDEARQQLTAKYVHLRSEARNAARSSDTEESPIPITVRQLEALVRISESLARMQLVAEATPDHVDMAYKLFEASTMNAMNAGLISNTAGAAEETVTTQAVEALIKDRLARGGHISFQRLMDETVARGFSRAAVGAAVRVMELRGELKRKAEGKLLQRTQR